MLSKGQIIRGDPGAPREIAHSLVGALSQSRQEETFPSTGGKGSSACT